MKPSKLTLVYVILAAVLSFSLTVRSSANSEVDQDFAKQGTEAASVYLPIVTKSLPPIVPDTTEILTEATTQHLVSVSQNGAFFTFDQMTSELAALAPGDVMVGEPVAAAPYGFLRTVTNISTSSGQVVVETGPATLEDAVQQGELHLSQTLSPEHVVNSTMAEGMHLTSTPQGEFFLVIEDVVLFDADNNSNTTGDQIRADGSITLELSFDFDLVVRGSRLQHLAFTTWAQETSELEITAYVAATEIEREKLLASFPLQPIIGYIGPFPVVIQPEVALVVGVDGEVYVGLKTAVTQQTTLTTGVQYTDGRWEPSSDFSSSFDYTPPTASAGLKVKGYTGSRLTLKLYGVAGPYVSIHPFLELEVDLFATPWWELYGGLEVPVGVRVEILGRELADYEVLAIGYRELIAQAGSNEQPPVAPSNLQATALDSSRIQLNWSDNSNNELGFIIYDGSIFVEEVGANIKSYTVEGLGIGSYHCYHIFAFNDYGSSDWTDWACDTTDSLPLTGTVTDTGAPVAGIHVLLQFYNGSTWLTYASTTTDSSGYYQFSSPPLLGIDQSANILWQNNDGNSNRLSSWSCWVVDWYTTDAEDYQCNFDLDNVDLISPAPSATVSLPQTFTWNKRPITSDDYEFNLTDMSDLDPWWWTVPPLGYINSYSLNGLPEGFTPNVQYGWWILVIGPDGFGASYSFRPIRFSNSGNRTEIESMPVSNRVWRGNIEITVPRRSP